MRLHAGVRILSLATIVAAALAQPLHAQRRTERDAFTWAGRIPAGRWITVRNLNGTVDVERGTGDKVEVTATRHTRRGDPDFVRFEVKKYGPNDQDVLICALWGTTRRATRTAIAAAAIVAAASTTCRWSSASVSRAA